MRIKKVSPEVRLSIINLSKCFWYWGSFYNFYAQILEVPKRKLELRFPKDSFNKYSASETILEELEEHGNIEKIKEVISAFYNLRKPFDDNDNIKFKEAEQELKYFKSLVGRDVVEEEIKNRDFVINLENKRKSSLLEKEKIKKINEIRDKFLLYAKDIGQKKQERAFWLERIFYDILELEQIDHKKSYKTTNEQIDGHFKFNKFDYLVEIKWTNNQVLQEDVSIFEGKLSSKGQSTRGFILSISGFSDGAVKKAMTTPPKIIFMDGTEFMAVLNGYNSFYDLFISKEDGFVRLGKVYK